MSFDSRRAAARFICKYNIKTWNAQPPTKTMHLQSMWMHLTSYNNIIAHCTVCCVCVCLCNVHSRSHFYLYRIISATKENSDNNDDVGNVGGDDDFSLTPNLKQPSNSWVTKSSKYQFDGNKFLKVCEHNFLHHDLSTWKDTLSNHGVLRLILAFSVHLIFTKWNPITIQIRWEHTSHNWETLNMRRN